ncbi:hypothetical protein PGTUg99_013077 [Puccinia graminis f. sp. tritici]|uniref:Uncharacterized protein n=1 Tax=Puccinia graminis f. sp. tritici TaxID=56615 RepID=A0A5B0QQL8_PUCGR|nr:hypothetical protein PGTUg99_013077 [Puccinia graminis f. sp. tritici]
MTRLKVGSTWAARRAIPTPSATPPPQVLAPESQLLSRAVNFLNAARPDRPASGRPTGGLIPPDYHP